MFGLVLVTWTFIALVGASPGGYDALDVGIWAGLASPLVIALLIIERFARRNAARSATELEEPNS
jgi:hypothetical protein